MPFRHCVYFPFTLMILPNGKLHGYLFPYHVKKALSCSTAETISNHFQAATSFLSCMESFHTIVTFESCSVSLCSAHQFSRAPPFPVSHVKDRFALDVYLNLHLRSEGAQLLHFCSSLHMLERYCWTPRIVVNTEPNQKKKYPLLVQCPRTSLEFFADKTSVIIKITNLAPNVFSNRNSF